MFDIIEIVKNLPEISKNITDWFLITEKIVNWLVKNKRIKEENIVERPALQVVVPILNQLIIIEDSVLREYFINLLCSAFDKTKQDVSHPAFPIVLSQLSRDEAVVLYLIKNKQYEEICIYGNGDRDPKEVINTFPIGKLLHPNNFIFYFSHLGSLSLAHCFGDNEMQEEIQDAQSKIIGYKTTMKFLLTDFGKIFTKACIPEGMDLDSLISIAK